MVVFYQHPGGRHLPTIRNIISYAIVASEVCYTASDIENDQKTSIVVREKASKKNRLA